MRTITLGLLITISTLLQAQQVLYSEDFEGATSSFALNTADLGGVTSAGDNTWLVNNVYAGGNGSVVCIGFPITFTVPSTAGQPPGIGNANGKYLHITSTAAQTSGILNANFLAADGLCANPASHFSRMTTDVTTGAADVTLSFWWLCGGGTNNYGEVYYSNNSGASWNLITTPLAQYRNQLSWVQQSITLPAFLNQPALRFAFRFVNGTTLSAQDPGFGLDDVIISAAQAVPNSIATGMLSAQSYCQGASLSVPFSVLGTYASGNVFTAQLSDASGSFASPVAIGSLASTVSGSITCFIPPGTPVGSGYRIRVVSDLPSTIGAANAADIAITASPFAGNDGSATLCKNTGTYDLLQFLPGASTCGAWTGPTGAAFNGLLDSGADLGGLFTYTTNCPGGCPQDQATLNVTLQDPANAGNNVSAALCSNGPAVSLPSYVVGGQLTGIFFHQGQPTNGSFLNVPGIYDLIYVVYGTGPCANDTAEFTFTVNAAANSGQSLTHTVCSNAPAVDLLSLLFGAQPGGTWSGPSGSSSNGILDPATGPSGLYTYVVTGIAPCANSSSFVAVVIDPCAGILDNAAGEGRFVWLGQESGDHLFRNDIGVIASLELIDAAGRVEQFVSDAFDKGVIRIAMSGSVSGMKVIRIRTADGRFTTRFVHIE